MNRKDKTTENRVTNELMHDAAQGGDAADAIARLMHSVVMVCNITNPETLGAARHVLYAGQAACEAYGQHLTALTAVHRGDATASQAAATAFQDGGSVVINCADPQEDARATALATMALDGTGPSGAAFRIFLALSKVGTMAETEGDSSQHAITAALVAFLHHAPEDALIEITTPKAEA